MKLKLTEAQVTQACIQWLRLKGYTCIRLQSGLVNLPGDRKMRVGTPGLPDWVVVNGRNCFFLELKATGKQPNTNQDLWMFLAGERGILCLWADSLEMLQAKMKEMHGDAAAPYACRIIANR